MMVDDEVGSGRDGGGLPGVSKCVTRRTMIQDLNRQAPMKAVNTTSVERLSPMIPFLQAVIESLGSARRTCC